VTCGFESGGERTRTVDFYVANVALYQLSYTPEGEDSVPKRGWCAFRAKGAGDQPPVERWADSIAAWSLDATIAVVRSPRVRSSTARSASVVRRRPPVTPSG
jgi:hypothetical protein